jgi:hypothetical protein
VSGFGLIDNLAERPHDQDGGLRSGVGVDSINVAVGDLSAPGPK